MSRFLDLSSSPYATAMHFWCERMANLLGFVLVNQHTYLPGSQYSVAEFFIKRKYRKLGIGRQVAVRIFDLLRGRWEIYSILFPAYYLLKS